MFVSKRFIATTLLVSLFAIACGKKAADQTKTPGNNGGDTPAKIENPKKAEITPMPRELKNLLKGSFQSECFVENVFIELGGGEARRFGSYRLFLVNDDGNMRQYRRRYFKGTNTTCAVSDQDIDDIHDRWEYKMIELGTESGSKPFQVTYTKHEHWIYGKMVPEFTRDMDYADSATLTRTDIINGIVVDTLVFKSDESVTFSRLTVRE